LLNLIHQVPGGRARHILSRLGQSEAARNFGWLIADRGVRMAVSVIVGSWVARYLGRQDFGLLSYSLALVAIFAALTPLGMEALVLREIIQQPRMGGRWIGTMIGFRAATALAAVLLGFALVFGLRHNEPRAWLLVAILSAGVLFQSLESGELWFQAHTQMRRLVVPRLVLFLVMNGLKVTAMLRGAGVVSFSALTALEQTASGVITWVIVRGSLGPDNPLAFDGARGLRVMRHSWPLALSALSVILYMKLSQVMLSGMLGDAALGVYAAAIKIPEAATFIPTVLASSMLPSLLHSRSKGPEAYHAAFRRFFRINTLLALSICVPVSLGAPWIVRLLFGAAYSDAAPVMAVHVWSLLFLFLGVARGQYLLNELLTRLPLWFSAFGLTVNLAGCLVLIPRFGPMGAAVATVLSQFASAFLTSFIHPKTRTMGREQWLAVVSPWMAWNASYREGL